MQQNNDEHMISLRYSHFIDKFSIYKTFKKKNRLFYCLLTKNNVSGSDQRFFFFSIEECTIRLSGHEQVRNVPQWVTKEKHLINTNHIA